MPTGSEICSGTSKPIYLSSYAAGSGTKWLSFDTFECGNLYRTRHPFLWRRFVFDQLTGGRAACLDFRLVGW